jgi:guanylate kinase
MLVISSPSGAGKTTLAKRLLAADSNLSLSISVTTRKPRAGETDGVDYHFVDDAAFERMIAEDELLEWAEVHANRYGTPRARIEEVLACGRDILFDIDWQGAAQVRQRAGADVASVFILPPSMATLESRLRSRAQDAPEVVARRLAGAALEIGHWRDYDYVIVNEAIESSFATLAAILEAERHRRARCDRSLNNLVSSLLGVPPT